jgi:sucrose-6-phosphate hydrolase SacC (GH32 family)
VSRPLYVYLQGRQLLYGWVQEHRRVPTPPANCDDYSYAGCIATPRVLQLVDGKLYQTPLPELDQLRTK